MSCKNKIVVSEYVSYGHPDKVADQIGDALLDEYLKGDPNSRCGIEVMVKDNIVVLGGEVNSNADVNHEKTVRKVFSGILYPPNHHLSPSEIKVINLIGKQSAEIHSGVDKSDENIGAGDQGFCAGFASNEESKTLMPLGVYLAKVICQQFAIKRYLSIGPDAKTQVIVEYDEDNNAIVKSILVSIMHQNDNIHVLRNIVKQMIIDNTINIEEEIYDKYIKGRDIKIDVNPCGEWHIGGSVSDCGILGRKIVVDAYGGYCNVGGGAYSGKDYTKVDRSGAYMCRYIAKNIVKSGIADTAKVELSYMIGEALPCSLNIELNRNQDKVCQIKDYLFSNIDMTPRGIIKKFDGSFPRNYKLARYGHYGECEHSLIVKYYPWEVTDFADDLKNNVQF